MPNQQDDPSRSAQDTLSKTLERLLRSNDFAEIVPGPKVRIDLRYASVDNFTGQDLYGSFNRAFLHREAYAGLGKAIEAVIERAPNHKLIFYDALRPRAVQRILWAHVVGTPNQRYLADPDKGSLHNYGFAIDLSILDEAGRELDMGAGFDDFREIAHPAHESKYLASGELKVAQVANRRLLRDVMAAGKFKPLPHEWWHFDWLSRAEAEANYNIVE